MQFVAKCLPHYSKVCVSGCACARVCAPVFCSALKGRKATCFPGFEAELTGAEISSAPVVTDGTVTTAKGLGCALDLGLELIRLLIGGEKAAEIKAAIQYK